MYRSKITNKEGKHNEMEKNVWGCEQSGKASLLNQMLKGEGPFSVLYDQVATPSGHDLYVREHFNNGMGLWIVDKQFEASCSVDLRSKQVHRIESVVARCMTTPVMLFFATARKRCP